MKKMGNKTGQGMIEYVLIVGLIVAFIVGVFWSGISSSLSSKISAIAGSLK